MQFCIFCGNFSGRSAEGDLMTGCNWNLEAPGGHWSYRPLLQCETWDSHSGPSCKIWIAIFLTNTHLPKHQPPVMIFIIFLKK